MKRPSIYVKMKVLGAIDVVEGKTRHERIQNAAQMTFLDEQGNPHRFTWRTIQTWHYRYKNSGITGMTNHSRADKGATRKVTPEEVLEAINTGHPGSISTIHADSPRLALERMAMMVLRAGLNLSREDVLDYARATIDIVIQTGRQDGRRGVLQVFMPALS